jgi:YD repeat-containing protein
MRTLLLLPFLLTPFAPLQNAAVTGDGSAMGVVSYKWTKSRQRVEKTDTQGSAPVAAMTAADKNFERNRRVNDPAGVRDPNADTLDARSAALDKAVRESRSPKTVEVEGFAYRVKVHNAGAKAVEVLFWEYQFEEAANPSNLARRQFLCGVNIKGGKEKELLAFSASGPNGAISVGSLANQVESPYREKVVINRIEYADGSIWQRKGWSFGEVRAAVQRAVATPWGAEMCRGL